MAVTPPPPPPPPWLCMPTLSPFCAVEPLLKMLLRAVGWSSKRQACLGAGDREKGTHVLGMTVILIDHGDVFLREVGKIPKHRVILL